MKWAFFLFIPSLCLAGGQPQIFMSRSASVALTNKFFVVTGTAQGGGSTTENTNQSLMARPCTWSNLYVYVDVAPGAGTSQIATFRTSGANSTITCTISGASATSCSDTTHSSATVQGELVDIEVTQTGAPASSKAYFGIQCIPTTDNNYLLSNMGADLNSGVAYFPVSNGGTLNATESNVQEVMPMSGTFTGLIMDQTGTLGASTSYTYALRTNGVTSSLSCTDTASNTCSDFSVAHSSHVVAGDLVDTIETPSNTPTGFTAVIGYVFVPDQSAKFPIMQVVGATTISNSATSFQSTYIGSFNGNGGTTETDWHEPAGSPAPGFVLSNLRTKFVTTPGGGKSFAITLRKNVTTPSGGPACTVSGASAKSCIDSSDVLTTVPADLLNYQTVPTGTPAASASSYSMIGQLALPNLTPTME